MRPPPVPLPPLAEFGPLCADAVDEALLWADLAGTIVWANRRAHALFGYPDTGLLGLPATTLSSPANSAEIGREIEEGTFGGGWRGELLARTRDGLQFPCQLTTTLVRDAAGAPLGLAAVVVDLRRLWTGNSEESGEAAAGRALCALIGGAQGDAAAEAIAEGTGMEVVGVFDEKGLLCGYSGDPARRPAMVRHPFPQTEGALAHELGALGALGALQGKARSGGVIALSVASKRVTEAAYGFFKAMLKILQVQG